VARKNRIAELRAYQVLNRAEARGGIPPAVTRFHFGQELGARQAHHGATCETNGKSREYAYVIEQLNGELLLAQPVLLNTHMVYRDGANLVINPASAAQFRPIANIWVWCEPQVILYRMQLD